MFTRAVVLLSLAFLSGCLRESTVSPITSDHPASADAAVAALPPPSPTLALEADAAPAASGPMDGMNEQSAAMRHDMSGMQQPAPATTQAAAVYTCPMHSEVTSDKPGKCPKCGMTLVKKGRQ